MAFSKGNKAASGGKREGAGRPSRQEIEIKQQAAEIARQFIEDNVKPVLENYLKLAQGWTETRYTLKGEPYEVFCYDSRSTTHFVDKLIPDVDEAPKAPRAITFIQFNNNPSELRAKDIPVPIKPAPQETQPVERQELEFYAFANGRDNEGQRSKAREGNDH